jgi:acetyl-CoA carboxylase carboxyl transferase subunit beta
MVWFKKTKDIAEKKVKIPEGLWIKCDSCKEIVYRKEINKNLKVCPKCNYHFRIGARERLKLLVDEGSFTELDEGLSSGDPLDFKDTVSYRDRIEKAGKGAVLKRL